jgi:hypothetical protein
MIDAYAQATFTSGFERYTLAHVDHVESD